MNKSNNKEKNKNYLLIYKNGIMGKNYRLSMFVTLSPDETRKSQLYTKIV